GCLVTFVPKDRRRFCFTDGHCWENPRWALRRERPGGGDWDLSARSFHRAPQESREDAGRRLDTDPRAAGHFRKPAAAAAIAHWNFHNAQTGARCAPLPFAI